MSQHEAFNLQDQVKVVSSESRPVNMERETVKAQIPVAITEFHHAAESPGSYITVLYQILPPSQ
jgi:hypothetical protein